MDSTHQTIPTEAGGASRAADEPGSPWDHSMVADRLPAGRGGVEHVVQFALESELVGPAPEIVAIELKMRVRGDAERIFEVMRPARFEFEEDQILGAAHPQGEAEDGQRTPSAQGGGPMRIGRKQEVEREAGVGRMGQTQDRFLGERIPLAPSPVTLETPREESVDQFRSVRVLGEDQQIDVPCGTDSAPGIHSQCPDQAVRRGGRWERLSHRT